MFYLIGLVVVMVLFPALRAWLFLCGVFVCAIMAVIIIYMKIVPADDPCSTFSGTVSQYQYWGNIAKNVAHSSPFMGNAVDAVEVCETNIHTKYQEKLANMPYAERAEFDSNRAAILNKVVFSYEKLYRIKANQIIRDMQKENK